jgi:hypothetical protein
VWVRVEFPTLKDNPAVTKVTLVNYENFDEKKTIFERGAKLLVRGSLPLSKRDECPEDWVLAEEAEGVESDSDWEDDD